MIAEAGITSLVRTVLLIIGTFVVLRFLGRVMIAKRNLEEEREAIRKEKDFVRERNQKLKNFGKVSVTKSEPKGTVQDVDYEEL
jgi:hypothetical protein